MADTYEISDYLFKGQNDIFILAHFVGVSVKYNIADQPGIIASIEMKGPDKAPSIVQTDESWDIYPIFAWNTETPKKNWAIGFVEDVELNQDPYKVLEYYAAEDYGNSVDKPNLECVKEQAEKANCYKRDDITIYERMVPLLKWSKFQPLQIVEIFRCNPEIYNLADSIRLDNEFLSPAYDNDKYNIIKEGSVKLNRLRGEKGYSVLYDMMRMMAGDISVAINASSKCTVDIQHTESIRDGRPYGSRVGSVYYTRLHLKKGKNRFRMYNFSGFRYIYLVLKDFLLLFHASLMRPRSAS